MYGFKYNNVFKKINSESINDIDNYLSYEFDTDSAKFNYTLGVQFNLQSKFNDIARTSTGGDTENVILKTDAIETGLNSNESFQCEMTVYPNGNSDAYYCLGLDSVIGTTIADLEFAVRCWHNGTNILWEFYEDGVKTADLTSTISGQKVGLIFDYDGANGLDIYIDNVLEHSTTTDFSSNELAFKFLGYGANSPICSGFGIIKNVVKSFNRNLVALGDSITFGNAVFGVDASNYIRLANVYTNYRFNITPILAIGGTTSFGVLNSQALWSQKYYNAGYTSNIVTMMIGTNDLRTAVALATIQSRISSIVSTVKGYGFTFVIGTVIKDHDNDPADRYTLNTWIRDGFSGADYVVDFADTELETNSSLYRADLIHPLEAGMEIMANKLWEVIKDL